MLLQTDLIFHVQCHVCYHCGRKLEPGDHILVDEELKNVSCATHFMGDSIDQGNVSSVSFIVMFRHSIYVFIVSKRESSTATNSPVSFRDVCIWRALFRRREVHETPRSTNHNQTKPGQCFSWTWTCPETNHLFLSAYKIQDSRTKIWRIPPPLSRLMCAIINFRSIINELSSAWCSKSSVCQFAKAFQTRESKVGCRNRFVNESHSSVDAESVISP